MKPELATIFLSLMLSIYFSMSCAFCGWLRIDPQMCSVSGIASTVPLAFESVGRSCHPTFAFSPLPLHTTLLP
ncbi:hypothetical protein BDR22DRAFT_856508 [Usnea florida]